ncbi:MAG: hypothetical protein KIC84_11575 [Dysgonomonas mossii]|uniref:hypothetical protein n=1 Tax=Dysgonomonas mossii TaxID=163665 RepID=UPI0026F3404F|nr:hypothetical protein [Dysgonomonas mossii]MBS5907854.1 hypothetical protein [Dysgonomonas mossii]
MEEIKKKIEEIRTYFVNKMINVDYEVIECTSHSLWIRIDDEYDFVLWVSNGVDYLSMTDTIDDGANKVLPFLNIKFSKEEQQKIWCARMDSIQKSRQERDAAFEKKEYERLKAKFENTK